MTENLYLIIERSRKRWCSPRIARISKRRPSLSRPSEQALVKLVVQIPDNALRERVINIELTPEHLSTPPVTVTPQQP